MSTASVNGHVQRIAVSALRPGPWQPRRVFDPEALEELARSIEAQGVLTPLRVVRATDQDGYFIVAGERRWRAATLVGLSDLPCLEMEYSVGDSALREIAILDNLHRANLRPGEEAVAVAQLHRLGLTYRQLGERLGKSVVWVGQRLAIAKLPENALDLLNQGTMTREEAIALSKLAETPGIVEECLEPEGRALRARLGGQVPESIGERVQAVLRVRELDRQRSEWAKRLRADGHCVLEQAPRDDDRRYVRLLPGTEAARTHHEARLKCDAWAWVHGRGVRYCTDPAALRAARTANGPSDPFDAARQDEERRTAELEEARDAVLRAWLATSRGLEGKDLLLLGRERVRTLLAVDDRALARLGMWLGCDGDRHQRTRAAEEALTQAGEGRYLQLWFTLELAHSMSHSLQPTWALPWLSGLGLVTPGENSPGPGVDTGTTPSEGKG